MNSQHANFSRPKTPKNAIWVHFLVHLGFLCLLSRHTSPPAHNAPAARAANPAAGLSPVDRFHEPDQPAPPCSPHGLPRSALDDELPVPARPGQRAADRGPDRQRTLFPARRSGPGQGRGAQSIAPAKDSPAENRRGRAPSLRSLVKLALACESAEELGKKLKQRYDRRKQRAGVETGRATAADEAELDGCSPSEGCTAAQIRKWCAQ